MQNQRKNQIFKQFSSKNNEIVGKNVNKNLKIYDDFQTNFQTFVRCLNMNIIVLLFYYPKNIFVKIYFIVITVVSIAFYN